MSMAGFHHPWPADLSTHEGRKASVMHAKKNWPQGLKIENGGRIWR
jgi:hypothetical protein